MKLKSNFAEEIHVLASQKPRILVKGEDRTESIRSWRRNGDKIAITFSSGKTYSYNAYNVQFIDSAVNSGFARDCFEYLKTIAEKVGLPVRLGDGRVVNTLAQSYSKIDFAAPDSILGAFLSGISPVQNSAPAKYGSIFPFGFNIS